MKHILLIGTLSNITDETAAVERMRDYVASAVNADDQVDVSFCHIDELDFVVSNESAAIIDSRNKRPITDYSIILFRGKFKAAANEVALVSSYAMQNGITVLNSSFAKRRAVGKVAQMYHLVGLNLPIPNTVSAPNNRLPALITEHLGYPTVVKDTHGAHGDTNFLVKDERQLVEILDQYPTITFMAQQVIPNDGDYRVLITGQEVLIILRQGSPDSHLNNTSQGGQATLVDNARFSSEILDEARHFAKFCDYEIAGVDVIFDRETGKHYYLEINSQPQIASGAFVDEKAVNIGKYFRQLLDI
ncbi:hypothetical protein BH09PAT3_BH09PAT3_0930 [soil metagenome]